MNSEFVPFPPEIPCFHQFEIPRVAHFPRLLSKMGGTSLAHAYAWASFHFELWEGQSVREVFAGVGGLAPGGGYEGAAPPCVRKFCIWWV